MNRQVVMIVTVCNLYILGCWASQELSSVLGFVWSIENNIICLSYLFLSLVSVYILYIFVCIIGNLMWYVRLQHWFRCRDYKDLKGLVQEMGEMKIDTKPDVRPVKKRPYKLAHKYKEIVKNLSLPPVLYLLLWYHMWAYIPVMYYRQRNQCCVSKIT